MDLSSRKNTSSGLPQKSLFMAALFSLMGAHIALFMSLIFLAVATPVIKNYIVFRPLYDSMPHTENGLLILGGVFGSLAGLADSAVFAPFALLLALFLVFDLVRRGRGPGTGGSIIPTAATVLAYLLPVVFLALTGFDEAIYGPATVCAYITLMVFSLFFRMSTRQYSEAGSGSPVKYAIVMLASGAIFIVAVVYLTGDLAIGEQFSWRPLSGAALAFRLSLIAVLTAALFMMMGSGGALHRLSGGEWGVGRAILRGLVAGLLLCLGLLAVNYVMKTYFFKALMEILGEAGEPTVIGYRRLTLGLALALGLPMGVAGGAYFAMLPEEAETRTRFLALATPLVLLAAIGLGGLSFARQCATVWGMDQPSLNDAAGLIKLRGEAPDRIALKLLATRYDKGDKVRLRRGVYSFLATSEIDLVPENIPRLDSYIAKVQGRHAYYKYLAMAARRDIARSNWLIDEYREIALKNSFAKGGVIDAIYVLYSLINAPATPENRALLEKLSDESLFYVGGRSCLNLARAWVSMGDLKMAGKFYGCAKKSLKQEDLKRFTLPRAAGVTNGSVRGRIAGELARRARVGLAHLKDDEDATKNLGAWAPFKIKVAKDLAADGSFRFDRLPGGRYFVGLLLAPGVEGPFEVVGNTVFQVDAKSPDQNLGTITVKKSTAPPPPKPKRKPRSRPWPKKKRKRK